MHLCGLIETYQYKCSNAIHDTVTLSKTTLKVNQSLQVFQRKKIRQYFFQVGYFIFSKPINRANFPLKCFMLKRNDNSYHKALFCVCDM